VGGVKAFVQTGFGGPEVMAFADVPDPEPAEDEVVVQVRACALNRLDLLQREAALVRGFSLPHVAGMDVAGIEVHTGREVVIDPVSTCGICQRCTTGRAAYCEQLRTIGSTRWGGLAELVAVPASHVHPKPPGLSWAETAAMPVAYLTAWHALVEVGKVQHGEWVLVGAAGAGVSTAIVQLAKSRGAYVVGTVGGPGRVARAAALGCDAVVDHHAPGIAEAVRAATPGGRGVDLAIDHVGTAMIEPSIASLALDGRLVVCGTTTGREATFDLPTLYWWGRSILGAGGWDSDEFTAMLADVEQFGLRPVIDTIAPFDELPALLARMESGDVFGKLVVTF
jgi:NADPH:quinone reductase-like Zn-dependent oxidoreductase